MFDVIWTDHDRELQGEHRAKKEAAKEKTSKKQKRASLSTKRSSVSSGDSPFSSFFRGHGLKRINTSDARSTNSSSRLASPSPLATSFDGRSPRSSDAGARPAGGGAAPGKCSSEQGRGNASAEDERSVDLSRHGSIFSKYSESDNVTSNSTDDISFTEQKRGQGKPTAPTNDTQPHYENATWPRSSKKMVNPIAAPLSTSLVPPLSPARPKRPSVRPVNLDTWQTLDLWSAPFDSSNANLQPTIEILTSMLAECTAGTEQALDVEGWEKELHARSNLQLDVVLQSLRDIWRVNKQDVVIESSGLTRTDELRWMLWALKHLDRKPEQDNSPSPTKEPDTDLEPKTLILYDSQEIATYLAATNTNSEVLHLSTQQPPSNPSQSQALKTMTVNSLHPTDFPPVTSYNKITTLTLPSLLPAVDIPPLLTAVNHALLPGGTLHLLLIDPMPRPGTLGRHMRSWLRTNLLPNIERSFRCANPSVLFPEWLAAASLRGKGSTITTTKFFANPARVHREAVAGMQDVTNNDHDTRIKKAEIRSLTGRTLWKTVWGPFVSKGARMWWEDPFCAEECVELGTIWEYHFIEGVKDAEAP